MAIRNYSWEDLSDLSQKELQAIKEIKQSELLVVQEEKGIMISNILYLQDMIKKERK